MSTETLVFSAEDIERTVNRLAHEVIEANHGTQKLVLVGILTRGKPLAERLQKAIQGITGEALPLGFLDITLYRDDSQSNFKPSGQSALKNITGKTVVLIDDVIFRGRTIRAALDALNDYGRPEAVKLLVLLDRGHRALPIQPDFIGKQIDSDASQRVNVRLQETDGTESVTLVG